MWSPASDLLAITSTDGGLVGSWEVFVYGIEQDKVVKHDVMKQVQADLARRYPGGISPPGLNVFSDSERAQFARTVDWVDVLACRWLHDPERLLVHFKCRQAARLSRTGSSELATPYPTPPKPCEPQQAYSKRHWQRLLHVE